MKRRQFTGSFSISKSMCTRQLSFNVNKATIHRIEKNLTRQIPSQMTDFNTLLSTAEGMGRQNFDKNIEVLKTQWIKPT